MRRESACFPSPAVGLRGRAMRGGGPWMIADPAPRVSRNGFPRLPCFAADCPPDELLATSPANPRGGSDQLSLPVSSALRILSIVSPSSGQLLHTTRPPLGDDLGASCRKAHRGCQGASVGTVAVSERGAGSTYHGSWLRFLRLRACFGWTPAASFGSYRWPVRTPADSWSVV